VRSAHVAATALLAQRLPCDAPGQGLGQLLEAGLRHLQLQAYPAESPRTFVLHLSIDPLGVPALRFGEIADRPEPLRVERLAEAREPIAPQARPGEGPVPVGGVLAPAQTPLAGDAFDLRPRYPEDRAHDAEPAGGLGGLLRDPAEPVRAGAPQEAQEHRLGLVVESVGRRDPARAGLGCHGFEGVVAHAPSGLLECGPLAAAAALAQGQRRDPAHQERQPVASRRVLHEGLVGVRGLTTQAMVHVADGELQAELGAGPHQGVEEDDGIHATGDGHEDRRPLEAERRSDGTDGCGDHAREASTEPGGEAV
jgi:hypothetical protein